MDIRALRWLGPPEGPAIQLLDQTRLPAEDAYVTCRDTGALVDAISHHCTCVLEHGVRLSCCPSHDLLRDMHTIDRLLFARHIRTRLLREEGVRA